MGSRRLPPGVSKPAGRNHYVGRWKDAHGRWRWRKLSRDRDAAVRIFSEILRRRDFELAGLGDEAKQRSRLDSIKDDYLLELSSRSTERHGANTKHAIEQLLKLTRASLVRDLTPQAVEEARRRLLSMEMPKHRRPPSRRTVNKKVAHLKAMLTWAARTNRIARNPIESIGPLPEAKHRVRRRHRCSIEELGALIDAAESHDERHRRMNRVPQAPLLKTVAFTGFRWGEAVTCRWCDLLQAGDRWRLRIRSESSKSGAERTNPIPSHVARALLDLRSVVGAVIGHLPAPDDLIFLTPRGDPWSATNRNNSLRWLDRIITIAKDVKKTYPDGTTIDWHSLRHSYAQMLRDAGVDLWTAQSLLGHRDPKLTAQVYSDGEKASSPKDDAIDRLPEPSRVADKTADDARSS